MANIATIARLYSLAEACYLELSDDSKASSVASNVRSFASRLGYDVANGPEPNFYKDMLRHGLFTINAAVPPDFQRGAMLGRRADNWTTMLREWYLETDADALLYHGQGETNKISHSGIALGFPAGAVMYRLLGPILDGPNPQLSRSGTDLYLFGNNAPWAAVGAVDPGLESVDIMFEDAPNFSRWVPAVAGPAPVAAHLAFINAAAGNVTADISNGGIHVPLAKGVWYKLVGGQALGFNFPTSSCMRIVTANPRSNPQFVGPANGSYPVVPTAMARALTWGVGLHPINTFAHYGAMADGSEEKAHIIAFIGRWMRLNNQINLQ